MSMTKIECLIDDYMTHYEQQLYNSNAFEYTVLETLGDFSDVIDFLSRHQDEMNSRAVDKMLEKYQ